MPLQKSKIYKFLPKKGVSSLKRSTYRNNLQKFFNGEGKFFVIFLQELKSFRQDSEFEDPLDGKNVGLKENFAKKSGLF